MRRNIKCFALAGCLFLTACGLPIENRSNDYEAEELERRGRISGDGGIVLFGGRGNRRAGDEPGSGIAVNNYLWRASLDTVAFLPLSAADPFGGVIITDWYSTPDSPSERFKVTVYILDQQLRADGVKVSVFRQVRDHGGGWADAEVNAKTAVDLENAILTRARQMRMDTSAAK